MNDCPMGNCDDAENCPNWDDCIAARVAIDENQDKGFGLNEEDIDTSGFSDSYIVWGE